ncbi:MAG: hypothetical protein LBN33_00810 [Desulfovibrio sp.]|jgi:hypothetical protein|nr:hypothetical protein [Desulfovibrio sp.]
MKRLAVLFVICALGATLGGCSWMGRTAGKTQATIERKAGEVEQGYHQGYKEGKGGTHHSASGDEKKPEPAPAASGDGKDSVPAEEKAEE